MYRVIDGGANPWYFNTIKVPLNAHKFFDRGGVVKTLMMGSAHFGERVNNQASEMGVVRKQGMTRCGVHFPRLFAKMAVVGCLFFLHGVPVIAADAQTVSPQGQAVPHYEIPAHLTAEEKSWFVTFQEGNFLSEGWQSISAEIMSKTPPEQQPAQKTALENLGRKIGMEWCRANAVRRVNSSMLKEWGDILRKTARTNPQHLASAIAFIDREVDSVLD